MKYLNHVYDFIAYSRQGKQKNTAISSQLVQKNVREPLSEGVNHF